MNYILGIDPGLANTGYALIKTFGNNISLIEAGIIKTPASAHLSERLFLIRKKMIKIINNFNPSSISVEKIFLNINQKTAIQTAMVIGLVASISGEFAIPYFEYTPLQIKKSITGSGRSPKSQLKKMIVYILPDLSNVKNNHSIDAAAVAYCHYKLNKFNSLVEKC